MLETCPWTPPARPTFTPTSRSWWRKQRDWPLMLTRPRIRQPRWERARASLRIFLFCIPCMASRIAVLNLWVTPSGDGGWTSFSWGSPKTIGKIQIFTWQFTTAPKLQDEAAMEISTTWGIVLMGRGISKVEYHCSRIFWACTQWFKYVYPHSFLVETVCNFFPAYHMPFNP